MRLVEFSELTSQQLDLVLAIYREAFEAPWEWPVSQVAGLAAAGDGASRYRALALLDQGAPVALAIAEYLPAGNVWYLHYLAVAPGRRGAGIGSALLAAVLPLGEITAQAAGRPGCLGLLLEAEQIEGPPADADREQRRKRIAFYRRHGARLIGVLVPRPPWAPPEMPDWEIMLIPGLAWDGVMSRKIRRRLCRSLMVEGYGIHPDAAWLTACLDRVADD